MPGNSAQVKSSCGKGDSPWVLNLATQATKGGADIVFVHNALSRFVDSYGREGITSLALPRIAAGLGRLDWEQVREVIDSLLGPLPFPIFIYEGYVEGLAVDEKLPGPVVSSESDETPVLFWRTRYPECDNGLGTRNGPDSHESKAGERYSTHNSPPTGLGRHQRGNNANLSNRKIPAERAATTGSSFDR